MKIKTVTYMHRNDFKAIYECEHCQNEYEAWGYNDSNFHENVIPNVHCDECGKKSNGELHKVGERVYKFHR